MKYIASLPAVAVATVWLAFVAEPSLAQSGNDVTIVLKEGMDNADPCNISASYIGNVLRQNVVETLTVLDPVDSTARPKLALSWETTDNKAWRFKLREGVKFHDGADFNAQSAVKSFERLMSKNITCLDKGKAGFDKLGARALDDYTLELTSETPRVLMPVLLSVVGIASPNMDDKQSSRQPVGSGPYRFERWDPAKEIVLSRFDGYWGPKPAVRKATFVWRRESTLRAAMVKVGEADIALDIAPQDATDAKLDRPFLSGDTTRMRIVFQPPLDDVRVRQALNLAIDRQGLIGTLLPAEAVAATQFMLPKIVGYNPALKVWPYDPAKAKLLLKQAAAAGVPVEKQIRIIGRTGFYPNGEEILQTLMQMWKEVGFNMKLEMIETAQWLKLVNRPYDMTRPAMLIQEMHDNNSGDAEFTMHSRFETTGRSSEISIPELDTLLQTAKASSGEKRRELYQKANQMIAEEIVPAVPMYHMVSYIRVGPRLVFQPKDIFAGLLDISQITFAKP